MELISMQGVTKIYRTKEIETVALEGVNLDVHEGEFLSVMGPSGCGKSTMLNIMGLLDVPTEGKVIISEQQTQQMNDGAMAEFRNRMLGFVFQSFHLYIRSMCSTTWNYRCCTGNARKKSDANWQRPYSKESASPTG